MLDTLKALIDWFGQVSAAIVKLAQEAYHKFYKGDLDYEN